VAAIERFPRAGMAAVVTGAASGIGRSLARLLAQRGCDLALADIDGAALRVLSEELGTRRHSNVLTRELDVAQRSQVEQFALDVGQRFPRLCLLVNNAGVALHGTFTELDLEQFDWLMGVNFRGVVHGTHAFLPLLQRQPRAHIVNISSIFGIVAPPGNSAYCASKFAVRGFSESVRHELEAAGSTVRLSVACPGGVKTHIVRNARRGAHLVNSESGERDRNIENFDRLARITPDEAAARIIRGIEVDEPRILVGRDARWMDWLQRLRPAGYWSMMARTAARLTRGRRR
jgi:NAD(P)-dependent dehydrogenase (short-subunit alcohol dehydrogenase family)